MDDCHNYVLDTLRDAPTGLTLDRIRLTLQRRNSIYKSKREMVNLLHSDELSGLIYRENGLWFAREEEAGEQNSLVTAEPQEEASIDPRVEWSDEQRNVITASFHERQVVIAPPGTGKTAVACARVAHLVESEGIAAPNILMISFTRTAVSEMRDRIATYFCDPTLALGVVVGTLDSQSFNILHGTTTSEFSELMGGYEQNIRNLTDLLEEDGGSANEVFSDLQHLIVDEAQDLHGPRIDLVLGMIRALPEAAGVTVLGDPLQGIYAFTEEEGSSSAGATDFFQSLEEQMNDFVCRELTQVFRTSAENLQSIIYQTRDILSSGNGGAKSLPVQVKELITKYGNARSQGKEADCAPPEGALVLFRSRREALMQSSVYAHAEVPHSLRMGGLPPAVHPWIALAFGEWTSRTMSYSDFCGQLSRHADNEALKSFDAESAWQPLVRLAGDQRGRVRVSELRGLVARSRPPVELCRSELGLQGPIIGTVHGSKGREADAVHFMLPKQYRSANAESMEEEARVLYVGATRARQELQLGSGYGMTGHTLEGSGRVYCKKRGNGVQVEFGLDGDFLSRSILDPEMAGATQEVTKLQARLAKNAGLLFKVDGQTNPELDWAYELVDPNERAYLGYLDSACVNRDLWSIGMAVFGNRRRPDQRIRHLYALGCRTVAWDDESQRDYFPSPWRESGFALVPVIRGFTMQYYGRAI